MTTSPPAPVLVADPHSRDLHPVRQLLEKAGVKNPLTGFRDSESLRESLRPYCLPAAKRNVVLPCLLFLALDLPENGGFELLRWVRQQTALKELPTIIIADSFDAKEVKRAAALGVARFVGRHSPPRVFADIIIDFCRDGTLL
jgi:CheY-like chemotaxis protein